jgi:hypothetical protein
MRVLRLNVDAQIGPLKHSRFSYDVPNPNHAR